MKKIILFDIDYTLFNTDKFREIIYSRLAEKLNRQFDAEFISKTKEAEDITKRALGNYEPEFFVEALIDLIQSDANPKKFHKEFTNEEDFENSVYPEVDGCLKALSSIKDLSVGIISTGENKFQQKKIDILKKLLHEDHINIFVDKLKELRNIIKKYDRYELFIVDDLLVVLELAKKIRSDVYTVHMDRKKSWRYSPEINFKPDAELKDLTGLASFILEK